MPWRAARPRRGGTRPSQDPPFTEGPGFCRPAGPSRVLGVKPSVAVLRALFGAVAVAVTQSKLLAEPLATLAQAMQAVARGDFSRPAPVTRPGEVGGRTEQFT